MAKRKQKNFQIFLRDEEWERFNVVYERAKSRFIHNMRLPKSSVARRLVGLDAPDNLVTQDDIDYFLNLGATSETQIASQIAPSSVYISETDTQPKSAKPKKKANGNQ